MSTLTHAGAARPHVAETWQEDVARAARGIRLRVLEHTLKQNGGYLSQACSAAEIFATLYLKVMNLGPSVAPPVPLPFPGTPGPDNPDYFSGRDYNGPRAPDLDRFFVSPGHYALVLYSTLIESGRMAPEGLAHFNQDGSSVEMIGAEHSPGFETMAGSLAQTLSQAAGVALARRRRGEAGRVWVFMSDGEFQEGQTWEALNTLSFYGLDSVGVYVDVNGQQCDGRMEDVMQVEPLRERLEAFGALAVAVDGHDIEALAAAAELPRGGKPLVILAYTDPCRGVPLMEERRPYLHYVRFKSDEERAAYEALYEEMVHSEEATGWKW